MTGQYYIASGSQKKLDKAEIYSLSRKPNGHFSCSQCDYMNKTKANVRRHIQSVHEGK